MCINIYALRDDTHMASHGHTEIQEFFSSRESGMMRSRNGGGASCSSGMQASRACGLRLRRIVLLVMAVAVFVLALAASDTTQAAIGGDDDGGVMSQQQYERERDAHVRQQKAQISLFLDEMDADQNGEVETAEAARYIEMHM